MERSLRVTSDFDVRVQGYKPHLKDRFVESIALELHKHCHVGVDLDEGKGTEKKKATRKKGRVSEGVRGEADILTRAKGAGTMRCSMLNIERRYSPMVRGSW